MREDNWFLRLWKIIYPMLIFFVVSQVVATVACILIGVNVVLKSQGASSDIMIDVMNVVNRNLVLITFITHLASMPILYWFYIKDKKKIVVSSQVDAITVCLVVILGICTCIGINALISASPLPKLFPNDVQETAQSLYSEGILVQILAIVIGAPIVEELIFRGLIFKRMRTYSNFYIAAIVTSICFGVFHGRIVQGLYGFLLGFLLAFIFEKTKSLKMCILFHLLANATSVALTNVKLLASIYEKFAILICGLCIVIGCVVGVCLYRHKIPYREE